MLATGLIIEKIKDISGFKSCIIVGKDGLSIDSYIAENDDKNFISAIVSSMFSQINKQSNRFHKKNPGTSILETDLAVFAITKIPIDAEDFIIFIEFVHNSDSIFILDSVNTITLSYFV